MHTAIILTHGNDVSVITSLFQQSFHFPTPFPLSEHFMFSLSCDTLAVVEI